MTKTNYDIGKRKSTISSFDKTIIAVMNSWLPRCCSVRGSNTRLSLVGPTIHWNVPLHWKTFFFNFVHAPYMSLSYACKKRSFFHDFQMFFIVFDHANTCANLRSPVEVHNSLLWLKSTGCEIAENTESHIFITN